MPVMDWTEHAERSLFTSHLDPDCFPHVMESAPITATEVLMRLNCARCNGSAWVAWLPAFGQGKNRAELTQYVEGLVNSG